MEGSGQAIAIGTGSGDCTGTVNGLITWDVKGTPADQHDPTNERILEFEVSACMTGSGPLTFGGTTKIVNVPQQSLSRNFTLPVTDGSTYTSPFPFDGKVELEIVEEPQEAVEG